MKYIYNKNGIEAIQNFITQKKPSQIFILTDENTQRHCLPLIKNKFPFKFTNVNIHSGDKYKNMDTLLYIWKELMDYGADRKSLLINLGGGMITDIGGFAAVTFKRGIDFIHIPTTLLGMVDASIGGKNGINFMQAKNQIGTIIPPELVWINTDFLSTLPAKEMDSGFAEMLKHGLIADETYWHELNEYHPFSTKPDFSKKLELIKKSVQIKDKVISSDPMEKGLRKILNFGHTLGHAIESYLNYEKNISISHGKSVAIGMILASYISNRLLDFPLKKLDDIKQKISYIYPPVSFSSKDIEKIIDLLKYDKKTENGMVQFVLLKEIGAPVWNRQVPKDYIYKAFEYYLK